MTRAPLTLGHLACCLPLQTLHTENACVYVRMCHGQQPLTRNAALRQKEITERGSGRGRIWGKKEEDKRSDGAPEHACVKQLCYECDEVIDGKVLYAKGHHLLLPSSLCQLLHHPNSHFSSLFISKKPTRSYSTGLGRGLLPI